MFRVSNSVFVTNSSYSAGEHDPLRTFIMLISACSILAGMWQMKDFVKNEMTSPGDSMGKKYIPDVLVGAGLIFLAVAAIALCGEV